MVNSAIASMTSGVVSVTLHGNSAKMWVMKGPHQGSSFRACSMNDAPVWSSYKYRCPHTRCHPLGENKLCCRWCYFRLMNNHGYVHALPGSYAVPGGNWVRLETFRASFSRWGKRNSRDKWLEINCECFTFAAYALTSWWTRRTETWNSDIS